MAQVIADITMRRLGWVEVHGKQRRIERTRQQVEHCIVTAFKARGLSAALKR